MKVTNLRCEYQENPLGIDITHPRLSWILNAKQRGAAQTAYQVVVSDQEKLVVWDTGKIISDQSTQVVYGGPQLESCQRVYWKVRVWDEEGKVGPYSAPAWWETGLLDKSEWHAEWIGATIVGSPRTVPAAPYLRKEVMLLRAREINSARLYVTALGLYEFQVNGKTVGADLFTPGWTDYNKRVYYQAYDVTNLLLPGENVLGATLGDGWYSGHIAWRDRQTYGDRPRLLAQLRVNYEDGISQIFTTDSGWKSAASPILENDLLMGETYDARREQPGWGSTGFDDRNWQPVLVFPDPEIAIQARKGPPLRRKEELTPVADPVMHKAWPKSRWIFDLGQNMTGNIRLKVSGPAGTTIKIRYAEVLDSKGELYTANLRGARATDYYILKGDGVEIYEPRFTFHGFRYVELSGIPSQVGLASTTGQQDPNAQELPPARDMVTGIVIHSDTAPSGTFACSDPLLNQLQHNILWGQKGNFFEVPTDCPQRDERLGWTGDAQVFIRTAAFNMDVAQFFTKWQVDLEDAQTAAGQFPPIIPNVDPNAADGGPAWADAGIICPWTVYLCYGDTRILETHYESMKKFIDYMARTSPGLIRVHPKSDFKDGLWPGFGDWLNINAETPKDLIGTAFFAYSTRLFAQIAAILGRKTDADAYAKLFEDIRSAYIQRFVTPGGLVAGLSQTGYILSLQFGLLPENAVPAAVENLVDDLKARDWHLSAGFVGSSYLPHVLGKNDQLDAAFRLLFQKSWPSWLYAVTRGATTIWERWDGWTEEKGFQDPGMNSFNHYAYGAIGSWLYQVVAGIDLDPQKPGYKHILFQPHTSKELAWVQAAVETPYGLAASEWEQSSTSFEWKVVVPPNTSATLRLPVPVDADVREGAKLASEAEGLVFIQRENCCNIYQAAAGTYSFFVKF
jgi:alpha-L-rhamnosidase